MKETSNEIWNNAKEEEGKDDMIYAKPKPKIEWKFVDEDVNINNILKLDEGDRKTKLLQIRRLLSLIERYIFSVEKQHLDRRTILPHRLSYYGQSLTIHVSVENSKEEFIIKSHSNELIISVKKRIANIMKMDIEVMQILACDKPLTSLKNYCYMNEIVNKEKQYWVVKYTASPAINNVKFNFNHADIEYWSPGTINNKYEGASAMSHQALQLEMENTLPGVVAAEESAIFSILYRLCFFNDSTFLESIHSLLQLLPTDSILLEQLDAISYHSSSVISAIDSSPKMSPRIRKPSVVTTESLEEARENLQSLLSFSSKFSKMSCIRLLYNLEVLSSRLMPTSNEKKHNANQFCEDLLNSGGLKLVLNILEKDVLPPDIDPNLRQNIYFIVLQLARYLLCEQTVFHSDRSISTIKPTPPKKSALEFSLPSHSESNSSPVTVSATRIVQTMDDSDYTEILFCLVRVSWAAAVGKLCQPSFNILMENDPENTYFRYRKKSQDSDDGGSFTSSDYNVSYKDGLIAGEALELLITCLTLRQSHFSVFYKIGSLQDFIIDTLLMSTNEEVRRRACEQFTRLSKLKIVARCLHKSDLKPLSPKQFLTKIILKTPVPLWLPSCTARGTSHSLLSQSASYFKFRCMLLHSLSKKDLEIINESAKTMLEDEIAWLLNFSPCSIDGDNIVLAGHIHLIRCLITCEGINKANVGQTLIKELLKQYLFPASHLIADGILQANNVGGFSKLRVNPKCEIVESRVATYKLLVELVTDCVENLKFIVDELIRLHHSYEINISLIKEYEYEPAVQHRAKCDFVGLKNAGATCYMNSVLQQLYAVPFIREKILNIDEENIDEECVFYQLQSVFGHLERSKLKYFIPDKFWNVFKMWGQPINVREQQDAFEFFTQLVDQVDDHCEKIKRGKIFSSRFGGSFLDQKICKEFNHVYEREQTFMALNLTVKCNNLQDSLDQFVKSEILEGDNAYYCEQCAKKRNTVIRMCISNLPQTLVIQLKRFHYDWETNRALKFDGYFKFPWVLDMKPYTKEGISSQEASDKNETLGKKTKESSSSSSSSYNYELVGVIVHSGQASAGHYYSYIRERRLPGDNKDKVKWFKFNDTTVEDFDMTPETLELECFGGNYKANVESNSSLPESRQRYWNAYMLFYESCDKKVPNQITPKKNSIKLSKRSGSNSNVTTARKITPINLMELTPEKKKDQSLEISSSESGGKFVRDSLSQLSQLLQQGDMKGLFRDQIPSSIQRNIDEENLKFLQNRDMFCDEYYTFIHDLASSNLGFPKCKNVKDEAYVESLKLLYHFTFNTYFHLKERQEAFVKTIIDTIGHLTETCEAASAWLVKQLTDTGPLYLKCFLLECSHVDIRRSFSAIAEKAITSFKNHNSSRNMQSNVLILELLHLTDKDLIDNAKNSDEFFRLLLMYAQLGSEECEYLLHKGCFEKLIKFLIGIDLVKEEKGKEIQTKISLQRRWTPTQAKKFDHLHMLLSELVLNCINETNSESGGIEEPNDSKSLMTMVMYQVLQENIARLYVKECVYACRELPRVAVNAVVKMLVEVSRCSLEFSFFVLEEAIRQLNFVPTNEFKYITNLLVEILAISDAAQLERLELVLKGTDDEDMNGLLQLIKKNETSDSVKAYQCIKCLMSLAKFSVCKQYLLEDPSSWNWSISWLKTKMAEHSYWRANTDSVTSNEDSTTRKFYRTTSAQVTLDEATALLTHFESPKMETELSLQEEPNILD